MAHSDAQFRVLTQPADAAARGILGWLLCRRLDDGVVLKGRIVETEGYAGVHDAACHSFEGRRTARNEPMYAKPGTAYVYFTYGMHWCMNVACTAEGDPQAVLLRAIEPVEGAERMDALRLVNPKAARGLSQAKLGAGPARLCAAMGIDRSWNGVDLLTKKKSGPDVWLEVGIDRAGEPWVGAPLRFGVKGSRSLSRGFG
jgi:DNA-3-methyladenine glycosylase